MNLRHESKNKEGFKPEDEDLSKMLRGIVIPPRPMIMESLMKEMQITTPNLGVISKLVIKDVGLTTGILRVVNAPFFGLSRKISSVENAISLIGLKNLSKLVTGILVKQAMMHGDMTQFWETAEGIANISGHLAKELFPNQLEDAYIFGLLQNIGVALIMQKYTDYDEIEYQSKSNQLSIIEVEEDFYETNHAILGFILSRSWSLSEVICQSILRHHDKTAFLFNDKIDKNALNLIIIGSMSNAIYEEIITKTHSCNNDSMLSFSLQHLKLTEFEFKYIKDKIAKEFNSIIKGNA